ATASVMVGQAAQFTAIPKDANGFALAGRVVTWSSNNTTVATVNASGLVTGVAVGSATITATSEGKNGTAVLTVSNVPVASVTVAP
ncbi:MAG: Ig domain-containing protein, partial [Gemmatimonadetes bacterium]